MERVLFAPRALPPLRPSVQDDPQAYSDWVNERERDPQGLDRPTGRLLQVVLVIEGQPPPETALTLKSLEEQTSPHWSTSVILLDSAVASFEFLVNAAGLNQSNRRIRLEPISGDAASSQMLDSALSGNTGSDLALIFPGDVWAADAVSRLAGELTTAAVVYADEDRITIEGTHFSPRLKPIYSPEFLLHSPYVGRPVAVGASVVRRLASMGPLDPMATEHDFALRACQIADSVVHIPEVLCHKSLPAGPAFPYSDHLVSALQRQNETGEIVTSSYSDTFAIHRSIPSDTTASIVIPFRDEPRFLRGCVDTLDDTRGSLSIERVLIDNGSVLPETATLIDRLSARSDTRILSDARPFNWAQLNNTAAEVVTGDVLLFLNNDIEALRQGWLEALCSQAIRPKVGAVGARLLYPDGRLQHCGVVVGLGGAAGHVLVGLQGDELGYLEMAVTTRECSAVTGACLATRRSVFEDLGGFDESLGVDLNDIDYCLRAQAAGLSVIYEPRAELVHHESPSRGTGGDVRDILRFVNRWRTRITAGDPYLNPHLTRVDASCALRSSNEEAWWQQWASGLDSV